MRWELISPILLLVVWQLLAMVFPGRLFPTPIAVAIELWTDLVDGKLISDMAKTLRRAAISFAIAMSIGIAIGILFGRVRIADRLFSTWVIVGLNLPAVVIAIVLYISLGLTETAIVLAVIINKVPLVITTIREGVRSFSPDYDELASAFRMPLWRRLRLVFIPQLTPYVLAAARTGLALLASGVALEALHEPAHPALRTVTSLLVIVLGMVAAGSGWFSWVRAERALRRREPLRAPTPVAFIGAGVVLAGAMLVLGMVWR